MSNVVSTVGQYELLRRIGSGGMAEVWMGRRAGMAGASKTVAIKLMTPRVEGDQRHRRMFLDEARLSMLMSHSNVVQVFDAGQDGDRLFLAMEWVDGLNLAQLCALRRNERRPWAPLLSGYIIGEVLRGLAYAHRLSHEGEELCVVHRDISPHNILISTSGEVKIADFGVARLSTEETSGMHVKGKLRYMAPEQLGGRSKDPAVDLYGAGAILHELLQGARFRDEVGQVDLYGLILSGHIPPLTAEGVPPELASLRSGLLQSEPRQRISTAERALEYLRAWRQYRNAAVELGRLCRGYMGITGPRSGIGSVASGPTVDALADTVQPSAATRTSHATPSGMIHDTSGPTLTESSARPGRRALLIGLAVMGGGLLAGAVGVASLKEDEGGEGGDPISPRDATTPTVASERVAIGSSGSADGIQESSGGGVSGDEGRDAEPRPLAGAKPAADTDTDADAVQGEGGAALGQEGGEPPDDASTGQPPKDETSRPKGAAAAPPRRSTTKPAIVEFRLRSPLRMAYARVGEGKPFAVDPKAERKVPAGRSMVLWKTVDEPVWREGKTFTFKAGEHYSIRLTTSGPKLE